MNSVHEELLTKFYGARNALNFYISGIDDGINVKSPVYARDIVCLLREKVANAVECVDDLCVARCPSMDEVFADINKSFREAIKLLRNLEERLFGLRVWEKPGEASDVPKVMDYVSDAIIFIEENFYTNEDGDVIYESGE